MTSTKLNLFAKLGSGFAGVIACSVGIIQLYEWIQRDPSSAPISSSAPNGQVQPASPAVKDELYAELSNRALAAKYAGQTLDIPIQFLGLTNFSFPPLQLPPGYTLINHYEPQKDLPQSPFGASPLSAAANLIPPFPIVVSSSLATDLIKRPIPSSLTMHGTLVSNKVSHGDGLDLYFQADSYKVSD